MQHNFNNLIAILSQARDETSKWVNAAKREKEGCKYFDYLENICSNSDKFISGLARK